MNNLTFRTAALLDLPTLMEIIGEARAYLKSQGLDQWQNGYPTEEQILQDVQNGEAWVMAGASGPVCMAALLFRPEADYQNIREGGWLLDGDYAAIHRVAASGAARGTGAAKALMENLIALCRQKGLPAIRIDTHPGNLPMQRFLAGLGFQKRGVILLSSGAEGISPVRWAYELAL